MFTASSMAPSTLPSVHMEPRAPTKQTSFIDPVSSSLTNQTNQIATNAIPRAGSHVSYKSTRSQPSSISRAQFNANRQPSKASQIQRQPVVSPNRRTSKGSYQEYMGAYQHPSSICRQFSSASYNPSNVCPHHANALADYRQPSTNVGPPPAQVCQQPRTMSSTPSRFASRTSQYSRNTSDSVAQCLNPIPEIASVRDNSLNCPSLRHSSRAPIMRQQVGTSTSNSNLTLSSHQSYIESPYILSFCTNCGQHHAYYNPAASSLNHKHYQQGTELLQHIPCMSSSGVMTARSTSCTSATTPRHTCCHEPGAVDPYLGAGRVRSWNY